MKNQKIRVITGQTATGKTQKALEIIQSNGGYIISADSRQVYKDLDIVTGKDIEKKNFVEVDTLILLDGREVSIGYYTIQNVKVWGYDLITPHIPFSSHDYTVVVDHIVSNTIDNTSIPIVVGGTYLYLQHLLYGFEVSVPPNKDLRKELESYDVIQLQARLQSIDSHTLSTMNDSDSQNPRRLIRKIEIAEHNPHTYPHLATQRAVSYELVSYDGLYYSNRERLVEAITRRVDARIQAGALDEVKMLLETGHSSHDPGLQTFGYKDLIPVVLGSISLEKAREQWITSEIQYAKKQRTFMKKDNNVTWQPVDLLK